MKVVGLMSGTSADGIDAALMDIDGLGDDISVKPIDYICVPFDTKLKNKIFDCFNKEKSNIEKICELNFELGFAFASAVKEICAKTGLALESLDLIGSHGQTVYHIPPYSAEKASTLQLGEPSVIAYETKTNVVSNFRAMDMAAGGHGAPLVPFTEYILFRDKITNIALQNIGGISNVTVIPKNCGISDVFAFDTGPGNMLIDWAAKTFFSKPFDCSGQIASRGTVNHDMLSYLMAVPHIKKAPPKTTGRELFGYQFAEDLRNRFKEVLPEDFIATLTMFTAESISENYKLFVYPKIKLDRVIICGGGASNLTLMDYMRKLLSIEICTADDIGISSDSKEAVAFGLLAYLHLKRIPANVPGATGAERRMVLGSLTPYDTASE